MKDMQKIEESWQVLNDECQKFMKRKESQEEHISSLILFALIFVSTLQINYCTTLIRTEPKPNRYIIIQKDIHWIIYQTCKTQLCVRVLSTCSLPCLGQSSVDSSELQLDQFIDYEYGPNWAQLAV